MTLRALIICPSGDLSARLGATLASIDSVHLGRVLNAYPNAAELSRAIRVNAPEVVFLSFEDMESARATAELIEKEAPGVAIAGIHHQFDAAILRATMRCGVREFLSEPFERAALLESLTHIEELLARNPVRYTAANEVFSFLPSKPGVGASTLALNVSAALARLPDTRVLLSDFDMNSGVLRFSLNLSNQRSVIDAVEHAAHLDEKLWGQLVTPLGNLDLLHAGVIHPSLRIETERLHQVIAFMRRSYPLLCFDLSGNLERYSVEIMQESRRVILVCTAEYPSLHLAREKCEFLRKYNLAQRIDIVLNRVSRNALLTTRQVEEVLAMPVKATFVNDYDAVTRALSRSTLIDSGSRLGGQIAQFAHGLVHSQEAPPAGGIKRRLLSFLSAPESAPPLKART